MPEMRAETEREARRRGLTSEKATDPTDLTGMSRGAPLHRTECVDPHAPERDVIATPESSDPATREEHLRSRPDLKGGSTGGPS